MCSSTPLTAFPVSCAHLLWISQIFSFQPFSPYSLLYLSHQSQQEHFSNTKASLSGAADLQQILTSPPAPLDLGLPVLKQNTCCILAFSGHIHKVSERPCSAAFLPPVHPIIPDSNLQMDQLTRMGIQVHRKFLTRKYKTITLA